MLPFAGLVIFTAGTGTVLFTVTVMLALAVLPMLSRAVAVNVWLPSVKLVVLRETE